jgi:hypothetical protein
VIPISGSRTTDPARSFRVALPRCSLTVDLTDAQVERNLLVKAALDHFAQHLAFARGQCRVAVYVLPDPMRRAAPHRDFVISVARSDAVPRTHRPLAKLARAFGRLPASALKAPRWMRGVAAPVGNLGMVKSWA